MEGTFKDSSFDIFQENELNLIEDVIIKIIHEELWGKLLYENFPMQYTEIFKVVKNENF